MGRTSVHLAPENPLTHLKGKNVISNSKTAELVKREIALFYGKMNHVLWNTNLLYKTSGKGKKHTNEVDKNQSPFPEIFYWHSYEMTFYYRKPVSLKKRPCG